MEKIRREIKLFWTRNGKSLFQIIGFVVIVIIIVQALNNLAKLQNEEESSKIDYEQIAKEQLQLEKQEKQYKEDKEFIFTFIKYCNEKNILQAYELLSDECKNNKYPTIKEFEEKYINTVFYKKKDCEIVKQENNIYKITFLKDILQTGSLDNRVDLEDYYIIQEDVLGNKKLDINIHNSI